MGYGILIIKWRIAQVAGTVDALNSYGKMKCKYLPSCSNIPQILQFVIERKKSEKGLIL